MLRLNRNLLRGVLGLIVLSWLIAMPAVAQGNGSVPPGKDEAPDPGFPHNMVGRNIGSIGSLPDHGNYCGPLPGHLCYGSVGFNYVLRQDPFAPSVWANHLGNAHALTRSTKKGWPLQTVTVVLPDGSPVENARVRFFASGYSGRGIRGLTDKQGQFRVAVRRTNRSHRFLVDVFGFPQERLDVVGSDLTTAGHRIVLKELGRSDLLGRVAAQPVATHRIAVVGDTQLPAKLAKDYRKAQQAMSREKWNVAIPELKALVERWPVGTLEDGGEYNPHALLVRALQSAGETSLAEEVAQFGYAVVEMAPAG